MRNISINDCIAFVVLMDYVEGLAVPESQGGSLSVYYVVSEDAHQLLDLGLDVDHYLGSLSDLLHAKFLFAPNIFVQNLEKKFSNQHFNVLLVRLLSVYPFMVHAAYVVFIFFA